MSAKKQAVKKQNRKNTSKSASYRAENKRRNSHGKSEAENERSLLTARVKAIICSALAAFFLALIFMKGEFIWTAVRGFFFGVFGAEIFLLPVLFIYLAVITEKEKCIAHRKIKIIICSLIILFIGALIYVACGAYFKDQNFFACLGRLYTQTADTSVYMTFGCGLIGGILGYPIAYFCGNTVALVLSVIAIAALIAVVTKISVRDIGLAASRRINKARLARERHIQQRREQHEHEKAERAEPVSNGITVPFDNPIDIPLDDKSKSSRKRKRPSNPVVNDGINVDYVDSEEGNATQKDLSEDLINIINRAGKAFGEDGSTTLENIADDISDEKRSNHFENGAKQADPETVPVDLGSSSKKKKRNGRDNSSEEIPELKKAGYTPDNFSDEPSKEKIYHYPPVQLLRLPSNNNDKHAIEEMQNNARKLIETLDSFGVKASITNICRGPSVTRYELQPSPGVKISKITNLSDDIALNLAANGVRIEAPIPGKAAVGIEIPNKVVSMVSMRELIDSDKFRDAKSKLTAVLGRDISGDIVITDISKMPHLLIAGTTGSGKSVCVNSLLMSILYKATPDEVKLLLIDPKMVEFAKYRGIPHLLIPVVNDSKKAAGALAWAVNEMEQRYRILSEFGCKDIGSYNKLIEKNLDYIKTHPPVKNEEGELVQLTLEVDGLPVSKEKMASVVIAIDELADLMMTAPSEVEDSIQRLAQKARAAGMHLILATQRPTVNVITGTIKANIPSRISLKVSSNTESRIILDSSGGEKLIGKGDMLFLPVGAPKPLRVQGCFATDEEIEGVTAFIKKSYKAQYNQDIEESIKRIAAEEINSGKKSSSKDDDGGLDLDSMIEDAIKVCIDAGQASTSLVQRKLKVGYARAGRMVDEMEQLGIVGPHQGSKPRDVLMTYSEWLERRNILQNQSG